MSSTLKNGWTVIIDLVGRGAGTLPTVEDDFASQADVVAAVIGAKDPGHLTTQLRHQVFDLLRCPGSRLLRHLDC